MDSVRAEVDVRPRGPVVDAHPYLSAPTFLSREDLSAFQITTFEEAAGPIELAAYRGERSPVLGDLQPKIDPRYERFTRQQFVEFHAVRRDVHYTSAGLEGVLVLAGKNLQPAVNAHALKPIQRRISLWVTSALAASLGLAFLCASLQGQGAYFAPLNARLVLSWGLASVMAVPFFGGLLRAWRPGWGLGVVRRAEIAFGLVALVAVVAMPALAWSARPSAAEVNDLVARRDIVLARVAVDALVATRGRTVDNLEADDAVRLAEADGKNLEGKLATLDAVAARGGSKSGEARTEAHALRIASIQQSIDGGKPADALAHIDQWYGQTWKSDPVVAELRASADDLAEKQCTGLACTFAQATAAQTAAPTDERARRAQDARARLVEELTPPSTPPAGEALVAKLVRLRRVGTDAAVVATAPGSDAELQTKAQQARTWAEAEKGKVAAIGSSEDAVAELYGAVLSADVPHSLVLGSTRIFVTTDANRVCRGLYVVGATKGARAVGNDRWTPTAILSQAVGHAAAIKAAPPSASLVSKWWDGTSVTARWNGSELVELRIGDATP